MFHDAIFRMVLACQAVNILGVMQPDQVDIRETVATVSQLIEMSQVLVNSTLQLMLNDESSVPFSCTSDPFADYQSLTKHVNMVDLVFKVRNKSNLSKNLRTAIFESIYLII